MVPNEIALRQQMHTLYSDHHGWLHAWLRKKLGCSHHAADVAHDTFVRIMVSRDALPGMREPRAYLTTTAQHLMANQYRRQRMEQAYLAECLALADAAQGAPSSEEILMAVQALEQIAQALQNVSTKAREAFMLHYLEGLTQSDVARELNVSTRMVQKYLVQALTGCQQALD
jgi:RNA polymerase sigma factor (sigma-70 family)